jgi:hypothetical protein
MRFEEAAYGRKRQYRPCLTPLHHEDSSQIRQLLKQLEKIRTRANVSRKMICSDEGPLTRAALEKSLRFRIGYGRSQLVLRRCHVRLHCKCIERQWLRVSEVEENLGKAVCGECKSQIIRDTVRRPDAAEAERPPHHETPPSTITQFPVEDAAEHRVCVPTWLALLSTFCSLQSRLNTTLLLFALTCYTVAAPACNSIAIALIITKS